MKRIIEVSCVLVLLVLVGQVFGAPMYSASVVIRDQNGQLMAGVPVRLEVHTTSEYQFALGITNASGYVYLSVTASGFLEYMFVTITNQNYDILSSQGTSTTSSNYLYPTFSVRLDVNRNDVADDWEMPLAQKFCPVIFAAIEDRGFPFGGGGMTTLRPVPVEILDRDGPSGQPDGVLDYHDVEVSVYNTESGQLAGVYDMEDLTVFGSPYSNRYPDIILPYEVRNINPPGPLPTHLMCLFPSTNGPHPTYQKTMLLGIHIGSRR